MLPNAWKKTAFHYKIHIYYVLRAIIHVSLQEYLLFAWASIFLTFPENEPEIVLKFPKLYWNKLAKMGYPFFANLVYSTLNSIFNILNIVVM